MTDKELAMRFRSAKLFNVELDRFKKKRLIMPIPVEANAYGLTTKKLYSSIYCDVYNRYYKMCGNNILLPMLINDISYSSNSFRVNHHIPSDELALKYKKSLIDMGVGFDENHFFNFLKPSCIRYFQETFAKLYDHSIVLKKGPIFFDSLGLHAFNFYQIKQDGTRFIDRVTKEEVFKQEAKYLSLDITPYMKEIEGFIENSWFSDGIKKELYESFGRYEYLEITLHNLGGDLSLSIDMRYPELIGALNYIVLNPKYIDIHPYVSKEEQMTVDKYLVNGYQEGVFSGQTLLNPLTGEDIYIFISYDFDESIHLAFPAIFDEDVPYAQYFGTDILNTISDDKMINSDFIDGLKRDEARKAIMESFIAEQMAVVKYGYDVKEIILSKPERYGVIIPLCEKVREIGYDLIDTRYYPAYFNARDQIELSNGGDESVRTPLIDLTFSDEFIFGLYQMLSIELDGDMLALKPFKGENHILVDKDNLIKEYIIPKLFKHILGYDGVDYYHILDGYSDDTEISLNEYNSLHLSFCDDLLGMISPDAYRMLIINEDLDADFERTKLKSVKYMQFIENINTIYKEPFADEALALDKKIFDFVTKLSSFLRQRQLKEYVSALMKFFYEVLSNEKMTENQALIYLKLLSIVMPFTAQHIFEEVYKQTYFIVYEEWPFLS